jgi:hypothetical protein
MTGLARGDHYVSMGRRTGISQQSAAPVRGVRPTRPHLSTPERRPPRTAWDRHIATADTLTLIPGC